MIGKTVLIIVLGAGVLYGLIEARPLLLGPSLTVDSPKDGETLTDGIATISGHVARATAFSLDGAPLLPDENGAFSSTLAFPKGASILTLTAADRFGRKITITRTIYVP